MDAELRAQGGVIRELMSLANAVRRAAQEVAIGIENVAAVVDQERRGHLCAMDRTDASGSLARLQEQLASIITDANGRRGMVDDLAAMVDELRKHVPEDERQHLEGVPDQVTADVRPRLAERAREAGRKIARAWGANVAEPEPLAPSPRPSSKARKTRR